MALLTYPDLPPNAAEWQLKAHTQTSTSPLTRSSQTLELPGALWVASFTYDRLSQAQWRRLGAFLARCRGAAGRFLLSPPHAAEPLGAPEGAPIVSAVSSGSALRTSGWTPSTAGLLLEGDYLSYAVGAGRQMHIVTSDVASDAGGGAVIAVEPPIRVSPAIGAGVVTSGPAAVMRLMDDDQGRLRLVPPVRGAATLQFIEAFG